MSEQASGTVHCVVYRVEKRAGAYLYVIDSIDDQHDEEPVESLPQSLRETLGPLFRVMTLQLHAGRRLARADVNAVMLALQQSGYYLQLPPAQPGAENCTQQSAQGR
ncbi:MAG: YcgL domain-containing protein [Pseudomonadales bacterium]